jgi:hypothetical protein
MFFSRAEHHDLKRDLILGDWIYFYTEKHYNQNMIYNFCGYFAAVTGTNNRLPVGSNAK